MLVLFLLLSFPPLHSTEDQFYLAECKPLTHIRCKDGLTCIHKRWMCDGRLDCPDHSDELPHICGKRGQIGEKRVESRFYSSQQRCPQNWFFCRDGSRCLQPQMVCDEVNDCRDGSDEAEFCYELRTKMKRVEAHTIVY